MRLACLLPLVIACGGAQLQTVSLVNQTDRTIKELYLFPAGSKDKGPSRGTLAPTAGTKVQIKKGNVEVYAVSKTVKLDDHHRDTPTASQTVELRVPLEVRADQRASELATRDVQPDGVLWSRTWS
ncbi:hypothetical protein BH11MYX1_BH11MYX1_50340 [soil metagenome]